MSEPGLRIVVEKPTDSPRLLRVYALLGELAAKGRAKKKARTAARNSDPGATETKGRPQSAAE